MQKTEDIERRKKVHPSLIKLENDIEEIMDNNHINDHDKVKLLTQMQQCYKGTYSTKEHMKISIENVKKETEPVPASSQLLDTLKTDFVANEIILSAPKHSRSKIPTLLDHMKQSGSIGLVWMAKWKAS